MKPYTNTKHTILAQIKAREKRKLLNLPMYAIIDNKGKVIGKYRLKWTAYRDFKRIEKEYYVELKVVSLDENGKAVVTK